MPTKQPEQSIDVIYRKSKPISQSDGVHTELAPGTTVENGILIERDVAVKMRDGVTLYTDIYRPENAVDVPSIIAWSPYGKRQGYLRRPVFGVVPGTVSPMAKFEGPDPAYWCKHGYAIINPDSRGSGNSEGDIRFFCPEDGRDCYDLIEALATRDWSNGKFALSGNSWLAITQWFIAAEQPPHLAAIAPWEGFYDFYRHSLFPGGIPEDGFVSLSIGNMCGPGRVEDIPAMMSKYLLMNGYWEDKRARLEKITIPAYVVASWTNGVHSAGTLDGFCGIASEEKWLRVHNTFEWPDYYEYADDLRRFFDRYLRGIRNGWEDDTPRVRISVLDPGGTDQVNRPEQEFPLSRTIFQKMFLDAGAGALSLVPPQTQSQIQYSVDNKGQAAFTMRFTEDTELTGCMKLRLWVEADGSEDMDLFVAAQKLDERGNVLPIKMVTLTFPGAIGFLRVSHRELDPSRSTPSQPYLVHRREQMLKPKEIVPVEIGLRSTSMLWHAGQQLRLEIQGDPFPILEIFGPGNSPLRYKTRNKGRHIIHTGGKYDSHLLVPKIPR